MKSKSLIISGKSSFGLRRDGNLQAGFNRGIELARHREFSELLDGLGQVNFAPLDIETVLAQRAFEIDVGNRAEELALLAGARGERERERFDPGLDRERVGALGLAPARGGALLMLEGAQIFLIRLDRELARQQIVARVAGADLDHVAGPSQVGEILVEYDLHVHRLCRLVSIPALRRNRPGCSLPGWGA